MSRPENARNRTCIILQRVIIELLEKHSFQKITVNDICQKAMISRAAFYTHYNDKYHLLRCALKNSELNLFNAEGDILSEANLVQVLKNILGRAEILKNMLSDDTNHELFAMLMSLFTDEFSNHLKREGREYSISSEILAVYVAGGCACTLLWWITNNFSISEDEMAHRITELISRSFHMEDCL